MLIQIYQNTGVEWNLYEVWHSKLKYYILISMSWSKLIYIPLNKLGFAKNDSHFSIKVNYQIL